MLFDDQPQLYSERQFPVYHVVKLADSDDDTCAWPWYRRRLPQLLGKPLGIFSYACSLWFIFLLWKAIDKSSNRATFVASCFLGIQASLLLSRFIEDSWRFLCTKSRQRPRLRLVGNVVPQVGVVITTCGEDLDVVMDTVKAMCDLDYPADRFTVLVSDDAANKALEVQVSLLAAKTSTSLLYYTRPDKGGMKAGNMNAAFKHLNGVGRLEYCAFADVDMMFEPEFLRATLPHLIHDESVGVAVVPQRFYNVPTNDPLCQSLNADGKFDEKLRDSMGCAWNTGPGIVFRCSAVEDIGGYPENALAEEILTGYMLQGRGWKIAYCHEELQWGLVPATFNAHVTQRTKWAVGRLRNALKLKLALSSPLLEQMDWKQRISAFCHLTSTFTAIINRIVCAWFLIVLVATGQSLIAAETSEELRAIVAAYALSKAVSRAEEVLSGMSCGYRVLRRRTEGTTWLNMHLSVALIKDMLPKSLGGIRIGFTPTALAESKIQERDPARRPPLFQRLRIMMLRQSCWYHAAILAFAAVVFSHGVCNSLNNRSWQYALTHVVVPGVEWTNYLAFCRPITYAMWPPTMSERRDLMESKPSHERNNNYNDVPDLDTYSGVKHQSFKVWRPKEEQKLDHWDASVVFSEALRCLSLAFWCFLWLAWGM